MAYNELIKDFEKIRAYMREFYVYGFKSQIMWKIGSEYLKLTYKNSAVNVKKIHSTVFCNV